MQPRSFVSCGGTPRTRKNAPQKRSARTQVFAFGEDVHALRLVSELPDLRAEHVNWRADAHPVQDGVAPPEREKTLLKRGALVLEVPPRFELGIEVLQTFALPLGYGTKYSMPKHYIKQRCVCQVFFKKI